MLLLAVVGYDLQTWTVSLCLAVDLACTAVGLFIMLARQSGTRCQMNLEILTALIVLNGFWKQLFGKEAATSVAGVAKWSIRPKSIRGITVTRKQSIRGDRIVRNGLTGGMK